MSGMERHGLVSSGSRWGNVAGDCECGNESVWKAFPLWWLLKEHTDYDKHDKSFILIQVASLYVCYTFRPFLRPPLGMSIHKSYKGRYKKMKQNQI